MKKRKGPRAVVIIVASLFLIIITLTVVESLRRDEAYQPKIHESFLRSGEADHIINLARPRLERSEVVSDNGSGSEVSDVRTSTQTFLSPDEDEIVRRIVQRAADLAGTPADHAEDLQVVHYKKGQQYEAHWDACTEKGSPACRRDNGPAGPRTDTVLIYLNDVEGGGETEFPSIGLKVKPRKDRAVHFLNLRRGNKEKHPLSLHAGLPPTADGEEKWAANIWFRVRPYNNT